MTLTPDKIWIYRITHIDNLKHILTHGLVSSPSSNADPDFVKIGDNTLIDFREDLKVPVKPGGQFSEYVPFYFGPRSPMLFQIATGFDGIQQFPQEKIIYIVSRMDIIQKEGLVFVFTDGHARATITTFFSMDELDKLIEIDWATVYTELWKNDESDKDRQRRKQAECLIKDYLPVNCIERILIYNEEAQKKVVTLSSEFGLTIPVQIKKKAYYDNL